MLCLLPLLFVVGSSKTCTNGNAPSYNAIPTDFYVPQSFVSRTDWGATKWNKNKCQASFSKVEYITIHHSDTKQISTNKADGIEAVKKIQSFHKGTRGWRDIAYNFVIDSIGNVYQGRPFYDDDEMPTMKPIAKDPTKYSWPRPRFIDGGHLPDPKNHNNLGVNVLGCYSKDGTKCLLKKNDSIKRYDKTYTLLIQLLSYFCKWLKLACGPGKNTIKGHRDWKATSCPGRLIHDMLDDIKKDVQTSVDGNGLCIDYGHTNEGGKCINKNKECPNNGVRITAADEQCKDNQKCCSLKWHPPKKAPRQIKTGKNKDEDKSRRHIWQQWMKINAHRMDENQIDNQYEYSNAYSIGENDNGYYQSMEVLFGCLVLFCVCSISLIIGAISGYIIGFIVKQRKETTSTYTQPPV